KDHVTSAILSQAVCRRQRIKGYPSSRPNRQAVTRLGLVGTGPQAYGGQPRPVDGSSWTGATKPRLCTGEIFASAVTRYFADTSIPMNLRWSARAATPALPVPAKGSSTRSPGLVLSAMQRAGSATGNWAPCPSPPLEVGNTHTSESLSGS